MCLYVYMLKQKQEQKVIVNIHQEPKKKTKRRRRKPKAKPTLNPFYPERIIVPQIQMRQQPNLDFNKLIDALRVNNTSRIGNQRIQEPQAQRQERPPVIQAQTEPVLAERVNNMPEEVEFIRTEELLKSGQVNRPANFHYHQNREADDFFKRQAEEEDEEEGFRSAEEGEEKPRKIIKMKVKELKKKRAEAEAKQAEEPEQVEEVEMGAGGGGRYAKPSRDPSKRWVNYTDQMLMNEYEEPHN